MKRLAIKVFEAIGFACLGVAFAACGGGSSSRPLPPAPQPFALKAAGIYVYDSAPGVSSPQIEQYVTNLKTGAPRQAGSVKTGTGLHSLFGTANGAFAYGLDDDGNVWGYRVSRRNGTLSLIGIVASGLPADSGCICTYGSSTVWVTDVTGPVGARTTTVYQFPINQDGTLGAVTTTTLTGGILDDFIPPGATFPDYAPTAVWVYQVTSVSGLFTLRVYPVSSNGVIGATPIQTVDSAPLLDLAQAPAMFAYGVGGPSASESFFTFAIAENGVLTAHPVTLLPAGFEWYFGLGQVAPNVGGVIHLFGRDSVSGPVQLIVYPVSSSGEVSAPIQQTSISCVGFSCDTFDFATDSSIDAEMGPVPARRTPLPTLWVFQADKIDTYAIAADGTIDTSAPESLTGASFLAGLIPGQAPFSYGVDPSSGSIFAYGVNSSGALNFLSSFAGPAIPPGFGEDLAVFPPGEFNLAPVALYINLFDFNSTPSPPPSGELTILPLGANGLPSSNTPLATIDLPFKEAEFYVLLNNGLFSEGFL